MKGDCVCSTAPFLWAEEVNLRFPPKELLGPLLVCIRSLCKPGLQLPFAFLLWDSSLVFKPNVYALFEDEILVTP